MHAWKSHMLILVSPTVGFGISGHGIDEMAMESFGDGAPHEPIQLGDGEKSYYNMDGIFKNMMLEIHTVVPFMAI